MNNRDRAQWIDNDEGLYHWWQATHQSKAAFIRDNRAEIDAVIDNVRSGRKPAHYLAFEAERRRADHIDGYDRDDLGESPDY